MRVRHTWKELQCGNSAEPIRQFSLRKKSRQCTRSKTILMHFFGTMAYRSKNRQNRQFVPTTVS